MHEGARTGSITCPVRTVGGGGSSRVSAAPQRPPHMFPQRRVGPCTRYRSASAPSASPAAERTVTGVVTTSPASARTGARRSRQRQRARRASSRSRIRRGRTSAAKPPHGAYCRREERAAASAASRRASVSAQHAQRAEARGIAAVSTRSGDMSGEPGREATRPNLLHRDRPDGRGPAPSPPQLSCPSRSPSPTPRSSSPPSRSPSPWSSQSARSTLSSSSVRTASIGARMPVAAFDGAGQGRRSRRGARRRRRPRDAKADAGVGAVVRVRAK